MLTATSADTHIEQLLNRVKQLHSMLASRGIAYRIVGGMAVYYHVLAQDPMRARMTPNVDIVIDRRRLPAVIEAARGLGLAHLQSGNIDALVDAGASQAISPVHILFDDETAPLTSADKTAEGYVLAPVMDLVRMKLTNFPAQGPSPHSGPRWRRTDYARDRMAIVGSIETAAGPSSSERIGFSPGVKVNHLSEATV